MKKIYLYIIIVLSILFCIYSIIRLVSVYDTYQLGMEQFEELENKVILSGNTGLSYSSLSMYKEPIMRQAKLLMLKYLVYALLSAIICSFAAINLYKNNHNIHESELKYSEQDNEILRQYYTDKKEV